MWRICWPQDSAGTERLAREESFTHITDDAIIAACLVSIAAVVVALTQSSHQNGNPASVALVILSVLGTIVAWALVNTVYAFKYARMYFVDHHGGGFDFNQKAQPTYSDFAYLAFTTAPGALTFNAGGLFAGNAKPTFPAGDAGKVSVVAEAPLTKNSGGGELVFAYRNNTNSAIAHVDFTGTASAGGKLVATGKSQGTVPAQVKPGEVGFGFIYFEDPSSIPDSGVSYAFTVTTNPADTSFYNTAPLKISQSTNNGTSIVGAATNETGKELAGPIAVQTYCFDGNNLTTESPGFADQTGNIAVGGQASFTIQLLLSAFAGFGGDVSSHAPSRGSATSA